MSQRIMKLVPRKEWANSEEMKKHLKELNRAAKTRGFVSITVVAEMSDGCIFTGSSRTEDKFKVGGALISHALELMRS